MNRHSSFVAIFSSVAWRFPLGGLCGRASALPVPTPGLSTRTVPPARLTAGKADLLPFE